MSDPRAPPCTKAYRAPPPFISSYAARQYMPANNIHASSCPLRNVHKLLTLRPPVSLSLGSRVPSDLRAPSGRASRIWPTGNLAAHCAFRYGQSRYASRLRAIWPHIVHLACGQSLGPRAPSGLRASSGLRAISPRIAHLSAALSGVEPPYFSVPRTLPDPVPRAPRRVRSPPVSKSWNPRGPMLRFALRTPPSPLLFPLSSSRPPPLRISVLVLPSVIFLRLMPPGSPAFVSVFFLLAHPSFPHSDFAPFRGFLPC